MIISLACIFARGNFQRFAIAATITFSTSWLNVLAIIRSSVFKPCLCNCFSNRKQRGVVVEEGLHQLVIATHDHRPIQEALVLKSITSAPVAVVFVADQKAI